MILFGINTGIDFGHAVLFVLGWWLLCAWLFEIAPEQTTSQGLFTIVTALVWPLWAIFVMLSLAAEAYDHFRWRWRLRWMNHRVDRDKLVATAREAMKQRPSASGVQPVAKSDVARHALVEEIRRDFGTCVTCSVCDYPMVPRLDGKRPTCACCQDAGRKEGAA